MAGEEIYIARLGAWIARALGETGGLATNLDTDALGFEMPDAIVSDPAVQAAGTALADAGSELGAAADELDAAILSGDDGDLAAALVHLLEGAHLYLDALAELAARVDAKAATLPGAVGNAARAFAALLPRKTLDQLVILLLERERPRVAYLLRLLGLLEWKVIEPAGQPNQPRYVKKELRLERVKDLLNDPVAHLSAAHGWGTALFDPHDLMQGLLAFFHEEAAVEVGKTAGDAFLRVGAFQWTRDSTTAPPGLKLDYTANVAHDFGERIELGPTWGIELRSTLALGGGATFRLRPPFGLSLSPKTGTVGGAFGFLVDRNPGARPIILLGGNDLLRLSAENVRVGAELTVGASSAGNVAIDPSVIAELKGLTIELGSEGADSFLASLLAEADVRGAFDLALAWKLSQGLVIRAAGGLEIAIPMHQSLGPATLETLYVILKIRDDGSLALETSAGITGQLGPLTATVERMGVEIVLELVQGADADLGPLALGLRFKPPLGVGLAIDAGAVRGGGYLFLDHEKGEYAGVLELVLSGFLAVKAVGLVTTRMPDGTPGFSLLAIITAEFGAPIQLGFGFTLVGLGGLLGLNRTMRLDELAEGVRTGAVESVMFPRDVIANAPRILSDLKRFFPPQTGIFLVGPMAKLGWGTPTLITASLGVVIEAPPGNVAILGVLKCALPDEDTALLVLQVKFIGAIEPTKQRLWFYASLFGSRVLFITLSGEMGFLVAWGNEPNFVLSVGGFHPRFTPPPLPYPVPRRIALSILNESYARIRVEGYFAVTSNTAQFGARAELYLGLDAFSIDGHLGFDALFQFSPFYFIITFSASMGVRVFGAGLYSVRIRGKLEGTSPWHVEGEGSISLLFWDIGVPFSLTWGESADTVLPDVAALPILRREIEKRENWLALPPTGARLSVSLRKIEATQDLVLHPLGTLQISQRALPLDLQIQKVGNQKIADIEKATLRVNTPGLRQKSEVKEPFATAQFREIAAAAKLSAPAYEKQTAGSVLTAGGTDTRTSHAVKRIVLHELITLDDQFKQATRRFFNAGAKWFSRLLGSNSTARSELSQARALEKLPFPEKIKADAPGFVIADVRDNVAWTGAGTFASDAKARDALVAIAARDPKMAQSHHVIPAAEARRTS